MTQVHLRCVLARPCLQKGSLSPVCKREHVDASTPLTWVVHITESYIAAELLEMNHLRNQATQGITYRTGIMRHEGSLHR